VVVVAHTIQVQVVMAAQVHLAHTVLHQLVTALTDKTNTRVVLVVLDQAEI
jgi:tRNA splicing endonuclease